MPARYSDINASAQDFVVRKRLPTWQLLVIMFMVALFSSLFLSQVMSDVVIFGFVLFLLLGGFGTYLVLVLQRSQDLVLTTEFQNALFASALGFSNKFCLIIKNDGTIAYLDRSFQDMFPTFTREPRRAIDVLLEYGKVEKEQRRSVFSAIERGTYDRVIFEISDAKNVVHKIVMSIEPISRPQGYILLRGREFVEQRGTAQAPAGTAEKTPLLSKSSISLFSHFIDSMGLGMYMATPLGVITYANPVLERGLGFDEGELVSRGLSVRDIISPTMPERTALIEPRNFEGDTVLQRKIGGHIKSFICQKAIKDDKDALVGYTAIVHHVGDAATDSPKKTW